MLDNMTTGEKALIGATAIGIAALVFHKPTRNAVGLADGGNKKYAIVVKKKGGIGYDFIRYNLSKTEARKILGNKNTTTDQLGSYQIVKLK